MRKLLTVVTIGGALLLGYSPKASAASFTFDFCPAAGTECTEDGITTAQLKFDEIAGGDVNDYTLTATITGGDANSYVDELLFFEIGSLKFTTDATTDYTIVKGAGQIAGYNGPFQDNIPGCSSLGNSGNDVCFESPGNGTGATAGPGDTNTFVFTVNLAGTTNFITATTAMNFRFELEFLDGSNAGIFSPSGVYNTTTTTTTTGTPTTTTSGGTVPEPATLLLLGSGLAVTARRFRRHVA